MRYSIRFFLAIALFASSFGMAHAQTSVQFFSSVAKAGQPVPQACTDAKKVFIDALKAYPHPDKWTFIIACDDNAWQQVMRHIGITEDDGKHYGETDFGDAKLTYLRGSALVHMDDTRTTSEHVIAHELCHIFLKSHDEKKVDKLATTWVDAHKAAMATTTIALASTTPGN